MAWTLVAGGAAYAAAAGTQALMSTGWRAARDEDPPDMALGRGTSWAAVLGWSAATAAVVAAAQLFAQRGAALGWERVTGRQPPR